MNRLQKLVLTVPFWLALATPVLVPVASATPKQDRDDRDRDDTAHDRYYGREHKDYHNWNASEQRYWRWREYWSSEHRHYID